MGNGTSHSNSKHGEATPPPGIRKVNESVWEFQSPHGVPEAEIIFFHGLQLGDYENAFWKTWLARFEENVVWPKDWLGMAFSTARILAISYDSSARKNPGQLDMYGLVENLVSDVIMDGHNIGQECPIIIVGHCLGGIVIKQFILLAERLKAKICQGDNRKSRKIANFLENIKGIFYYGTPHGGFNKEVNWGKWISISRPSSALLQLLRNGAARERINDEFRKARENSNIRAYAIVENLPSEFLGTKIIVVDEESGRRDIDSFYTVKAHHFDICKPENMTTSGIFRKLVDFISSILEEAPQQVFENSQPVPKGAVGLDVSMEGVHQMLSKNQPVGIFGMGGIGKSTLVQALFNKLNPQFEYSCFVPEVKLLPGTKENVKKNVQNRMHHRGRKVGGVWSELRGKSFLLVLDDVAEDRDLGVIVDIVDNIAPAPGRFCCIVTSRDKELLASNDVDCYAMPFLREEHAKQLFISHSFSTSGEPPAPMLEKLVDDIVKKCDGLPLTLEVIGKYLKSKKSNPRIWEQTLQALDDAHPIANLNEKLWKKLRVSYDGLEEPEKQMFLDATTFFTGAAYGWSPRDAVLGYGWSLRDAKAAWSVLYGYEDVRWQTLVDLSLVYSGEDGHGIRVHPQLKSMGRRIASECKRRRWWKREGGFDFLKSKDDEQICSLRLSTDGGGDVIDEDVVDVPIPRSCLGRLKELQFLEIYDDIGHLTIDGENVTLPTDELILLRCSDFWFFDPAMCPRLAVLKLGYLTGLIRDLPRSFGRLSSLKILVLTFDGEILPDEFGDLHQLQRLQFNRCWGLRTLPRTFGQLSRLQNLRFSNCDSLDTLPDSMGDLCALTHLSFEGCPELQIFPESMQHLAALENLSLSFCTNLHTVPEFFGQLAALKSLTFRVCDNLHTVPESLGQLSTLEYLWFEVCPNLQTLPSPPCFSRLAKLQHLEIVNCPKINSLPFSAGHLPEALRHLVIGALALKTIPECLKSLPSLQTLQLYRMTSVPIELPLWLGGGFLDLEFWTPRAFHVQDGNFILQ